jgi:hypothetical protein
MNFDLRFPIGLLFSFYGALLVIFGLVTQGSKLYERSLNININMVWGMVMFVFGLAMLTLAWLGRRYAPVESRAGAPAEPKVPATTRN